eukprot:1196217-Prorocentrum_minimum.AAC.5
MFAIPTCGQLCSEAEMSALKVAVLGSTPAPRISSSKLSTRPHCDPRANAVSTALNAAVSAAHPFAPCSWRKASSARSQLSPTHWPTTVRAPSYSHTIGSPRSELPAIPTPLAHLVSPLCFSIPSLALPAGAAVGGDQCGAAGGIELHPLCLAHGLCHLLHALHTARTTRARQQLEEGVRRGSAGGQQGVRRPAHANNCHTGGGQEGARR